MLVTSATFSLNSLIPNTGVYESAFPSLIAAIAASLIFLGVWKSGSPTVKLITSIPSARIALALVDSASVADGCIFLALCEICIDNCLQIIYFEWIL